MVDLSIVAGEPAVTTDPEFATIPSEVRDRVDRELRREVFVMLHAEAVARGDLPTHPVSSLDTSLVRGMGALVQVGLGGVIGLFSVVIFLYLIRILAPGFV